MSKKPGVLRDPWRGTPLPPPVVPRKPITAKRQPERDVVGISTPFVLELKNYGGLSAIGAKTSTDVVLKLLDFCVMHLNRVEDVLADYGIVLAQLDHEPRKLLFYLQREDGWTLAIPDAPSRDYASVQLIQAVLTLQNDASIQKLLQQHNLSAYRL